MNHRKCLSVLVLLSLCCVSLHAEDKVIRLYDGPAPGSENWKQKEQRTHNDFIQADLVYNVVDPTLTVFQPEQGKANGTAAIICPGGGFHFLTIDLEGTDVAHALVAKGVTCFVLKYRLAECKTTDPLAELMGKMGPDFIKTIAPSVVLATGDGLKAMEYVRQHASEYKVDPDRIGMIGFSAGGMVTAGVAYHYTEKTRPNFVAPIYLGWEKHPGVDVPKDAPPMFVLAATDDQLGLAKDSIAIYQDWVAAGKSAELHLYAKGGHGFGMRTQNLPSDHWINLFTDWLDDQGFLGK